ncbi:hypothetical protein D3C85_1348690 [compost metagenome]
MADDGAVAQHRAAGGNVHQGDLVTLGNGFTGDQAIGEATAFGHALLVDDDGDIVVGVQPYMARGVLVLDQLHG